MRDKQIPAARILILDRSLVNPQSIAGLLEQQGFHQVRVFTDTFELIADYRRNRGDLLLWHLMLPADSDFARIKELQAWIQLGCSLAIVLITPDDTLAIRRQAAQLGLTYVLPEHTRPDELAAVIRVVLQHHYADSPWLIYH